MFARTCRARISFDRGRGAPKVPQICSAAPAKTPRTCVLAHNSAPNRSSRARSPVKCVPDCPRAKSSSTVGRYALRVYAIGPVSRPTERKNMERFTILRVILAQRDGMVMTHSRDDRIYAVLGRSSPHIRRFRPLNGLFVRISILFLLKSVS